jgi:Flp pilus assembly pilin Flp
LVEYAFLLVLVALVIYGSMQFLAPAIRSRFVSIANPLNKNATQTYLATHTLIPATETLAPTATLAWSTCASENGFCSFSGEAYVRYGADDSWTSGTYTDGVSCSNAVFGDPIPGTYKSCQILLSAPIPTDTDIPTTIPTDTDTLTPVPTAIPTDTATSTPTSTPVPTWTTCAVENAFCSFSGTALVRYGAGSTWVSGTYTDGVSCSNSVFGDPAYGTVKSCQIYR